MELNDIKWWHKIELPDGTVTTGIVDHCTEELATNRFGIPENLEGKTVLDVGCWDGYFSFLAERRGAASVTGLDCFQSCAGSSTGRMGFDFARAILKSHVTLIESHLESFAYAATESDVYDVVFYFGVLYHIENPFHSLSRLRKITGEYALIETAICDPSSDRAYWEHRPGFENDPTNQWYPSLKGLETTLKEVGFSHVELVHILPGRQRATVKAIV